MEDKSSLVLFYSSGCGRSRNMRPAWDQTKRQLERSGQIDCILIDDPEQLTKYNIIGLPTIKFFPRGLDNFFSTEYQGNGSAESLVTFALLEKNKSIDRCHIKRNLSSILIVSRVKMNQILINKK